MVSYHKNGGSQEVIKMVLRIMIKVLRLPLQSMLRNWDYLEYQKIKSYPFSLP